MVTTSIAIGDIDGDGPPFAGGSVAELADGAAGENTATHTANGVIGYTDRDKSDTHTAGIAAQGGGYRGTFSIGSPSAGALGWSFSVGDADLDDLAAGQVITQLYDVTIDDGHGGTAVQTVTVTVTGASDGPPEITVPAPTAATVFEDLNVDLAGISVDLPGQANGLVTVTIGTGEGAIALGGTAGLAFADSDGSDGTLTFTGSETDVNAALADHLIFAPTRNLSRPAGITLTAADTSAGAGASVATETLAIDIRPITDTPQVTIGDPAVFAWQTDAALAYSHADIGLSENHLAVLGNGNVVVSSYDIVWTSATQTTDQHYVMVLDPNGTQIARTAFVLDNYNGTASPRTR